LPFNEIEAGDTLKGRQTFGGAEILIPHPAGVIEGGSTIISLFRAVSPL
jgi:hypothetical protein